jgi:predicted ATP-dependent serine protease
MTTSTENIKLRRVISSTDLNSKKFNLAEFTGQWKSFIGQPEIKGSWLIHGDSGHGKTVFTVKLAKYLGQFGRVHLNSLEEGESESMRVAWNREEIDSKKDQVYLLDREPLEMVYARLRQKRNAPTFVIFDSVQFMRGFTLDQYQHLLNEFRNKLFVFTSHADGKKPKGSLAGDILYNSFVKIRVEGYRAFSKSRYGGTGYYDIWPERANEYHANGNKFDL